MADVQYKVKSVGSTGTREDVQQVNATIAVTDTLDTIHSVSVVFNKAFTEIPIIHGVFTKDIASIKGSPGVDVVTKTGMDVLLYQHDATDLASADHQVYVTYSGQKVP